MKRNKIRVFRSGGCGKIRRIQKEIATGMRAKTAKKARKSPNSRNLSQKMPVFAPISANFGDIAPPTFHPEQGSPPSPGVVSLFRRTGGCKIPLHSQLRSYGQFWLPPDD